MVNYGKEKEEIEKELLVRGISKDKVEEWLNYI
jgi:hypothetical protein